MENLAGVVGLGQKKSEIKGQKCQHLLLIKNKITNYISHLRAYSQEKHEHTANEIPIPYSYSLSIGFACVSN